MRETFFTVTFQADKVTSSLISSGFGASAECLGFVAGVVLPPSLFHQQTWPICCWVSHCAASYLNSSPQYGSPCMPVTWHSAEAQLNGTWGNQGGDLLACPLPSVFAVCLGLPAPPPLFPISWCVKCLPFPLTRAMSSHQNSLLCFPKQSEPFFLLPVIRFFSCFGSLTILIGIIIILKLDKSTS